MNRLLMAAIAALLLLCAYATKANGLESQNPAKDTILLKMKNGEKMMIITRKNQVGVSSLTEYDLNRVIRQVDSVLRNTTTVAYTRDGKGQFKLKDTTISVTTSPATTKSKDNFKINISRDSARNVTINFQSEDGSSDTAVIKKKKRHPYGDRSNFYINLGLNNWISRANGKFPDAEGLPHGLRPSGSRYIALGGVRYLPLAKKKYAPAFYVGLELAWYNFMLSDNSFMVRRGADGVRFDSISSVAEYAGKNLNVTKSKLVESVIKVPVGMRFKLARNSSIEIGGYAGYRIGSHTKLKYSYEGSTRKDKDRNNFYLNNFQYGLRAMVKVYGVGIFGEYGLQPVFSKGPDLRTVAFGISL